MMRRIYVGTSAALLTIALACAGGGAATPRAGERCDHPGDTYAKGGVVLVCEFEREPGVNRWHRRPAPTFTVRPRHPA